MVSVTLKYKQTKNYFLAFDISNTEFIASPNLEDVMPRSRGVPTTTQQASSRFHRITQTLAGLVAKIPFLGNRYRSAGEQRPVNKVEENYYRDRYYRP